MGQERPDAPLRCLGESSAGEPLFGPFARRLVDAGGLLGGHFGFPVFVPRPPLEPPFGAFGFCG